MRKMTTLSTKEDQTRTRKGRNCYALVITHTLFLPVRLAAIECPVGALDQRKKSLIYIVRTAT